MPNEKSPYGFFIGMIIALTVFVIFQANQSSEIEKRHSEQLQEINEQLKKIPEVPQEKIDYPDFYSANNELKQAKLITSEQSSYVDNNRKSEDKVIGRVSKKVILLDGKISKGYLMVSATVDNGEPLTSYDSIYTILLNDGGHLLRNKSLKVPSTDKTILLYKLNEIPYIESVPYDESKTGSIGKWKDILNNNQRVEFQSFISTARPGGKLHKLFIAYECDDETPDCVISIK